MMTEPTQPNNYIAYEAMPVCALTVAASPRLHREAS